MLEWFVVMIIIVILVYVKYKEYFMNLHIQINHIYKKYCKYLKMKLVNKNKKKDYGMYYLV